VAARNTPPVEVAHDGVIAELRRRYDGLTNSQKRIAEAIVDEPEFVAFATVDRFAARLKISPSTVVRFAYRIGLRGYPDLQEKVRDLVRSTMRARDEGVLLHVDGTAGDSLRRDIGLLLRTGERLDWEGVEKAIVTIVNAGRVCVVGGVTTFAVAYYTAVALERARREVSLLDGLAAGAISNLRDMTPGDVLIAFSFPPYARKTLGAVDAASRRGATIIGITDSPISPLRLKVDVLLCAAVAGIGTQNSLVGAMAVANAIVNGVSGSAPDVATCYKESMRLLEASGAYLLETESPGE
jgi:DNA-binding MurR/RpiR family transcriptional regulator